MLGLSMTEIVIILGLALLLLGPDQLPSIAKTLGSVCSTWTLGIRSRVTTVHRPGALGATNLEPQPGASWPAQ